MADIANPANYTFWGVADGGKEATWKRVDSASDTPRTVVFVRSEPVFNSKTKTWSSSEWRAKFYRGVKDVEGNPLPAKVSGEIVFRWPPGQEVDLAQVITDLKTLVDDVNFATSVEGLYIPACC